MSKPKFDFFQTDRKRCGWQRSSGLRRNRAECHLQSHENECYISWKCCQEVNDKEQGPEYRPLGHATLVDVGFDLSVWSWTKWVVREVWSEPCESCVVVAEQYQANLWRMMWDVVGVSVEGCSKILEGGNEFGICCKSLVTFTWSVSVLWNGCKPDWKYSKLFQLDVFF